MSYVRGMKGLSPPIPVTRLLLASLILFLKISTLVLWHASTKVWLAASFTQPQAQCAIRCPLGDREVEWDALRLAHSGLQIGLIPRETEHGISSRIFIYSLSGYLVPMICQLLL